MLPHPARPAEAAEDAQAATEKRDDGGRDGNSNRSRSQSAASKGRTNEGDGKSATGKGGRDDGERDGGNSSRSRSMSAASNSGTNEGDSKGEGRNGVNDAGEKSNAGRSKTAAKGGNDDGARDNGGTSLGSPSKSVTGNSGHDNAVHHGDAKSSATRSATRNKGARGTATTSTPVFVPPLAPSPPPGTPPTVHTRPEPNTSISKSSTAAAEQESEGLKSGSFGSILSGGTTTDPSGRAYHLRTSFNPIRSAQRLVSARAARDAQDEEFQAEEHHEDASPEDELQENTSRVDALQPQEDTYSTDQHPAGQHAETQGRRGIHPQEPERPHENEHSRTDTIRRAAVTICTAAALATAYTLTRTTSGWPQVNTSPGSIVTPSASLLGAHAWIWLAWLPVLAGAAGYAVWQWLPAQRSNPRQTWTGPISAGTAAVGALWLWAVQAGNPAAATGLAVLGIGIGLTAIHLSNTWAADSRAETAAADVPAAILLGVSTIALLSGLGSWFTASNADAAGWGGEAWALIALVAMVVGVTTVSMTDRGHLAAALTVVAGLTSIGFARLLSEETSVPSAVGAFFGGFLILVSAGSRRHQIDHAERRRQREWLRAEASAPAAGEALEAVRT